MISSRSKLIIIFLISLVFGSCRKDKVIIPTVPVDIYVPISFIQNTNKMTYKIVSDENGFGKFIYGSKPTEFFPLSSKVFGNGVFLFFSSPSLISEPYIFAFDRTCTFKAFEDYCACEILEGVENIVECPCCHSQFILDIYGQSLTGSIAEYPLVIYNVDVLGSSIRIYR